MGMLCCSRRFPIVAIAIAMIACGAATTAPDAVGPKAQQPYELDFTFSPSCRANAAQGPTSVSIRLLQSPQNLSEFSIWGRNPGGGTSILTLLLSSGSAAGNLGGSGYGQDESGRWGSFQASASVHIVGAAAHAFSLAISGSADFCSVFEAVPGTPYTACAQPFSCTGANHAAVLRPIND